MSMYETSGDYTEDNDRMAETADATGVEPLPAAVNPSTTLHGDRRDVHPDDVALLARLDKLDQMGADERAAYSQELADRARALLAAEREATTKALLRAVREQQPTEGSDN
ncbi:MAG TPA: hypothetical protein VLF91_00565 [Candidatus Saccharimonadales bacterium]|nr:hypothetical protein [Candidatus Saccharimonadales bacterium]